MSGERAPLPPGGNGLLIWGSRTRSYGSLVRSPLSPVRQRRIEHTIQSGETLQGLALKYGVSMEQIKRANRLYTNDSIFLKKSLSIPVQLSDVDYRSNSVEDVDSKEEDTSSGISAQNGHTVKKQDGGKEMGQDLTPVDFLNRLDGLISQSKQAAIKGCQDAEKRVAALEAACDSAASDWRPLTRSQSVVTSSRMQQANGAVPLTIIKISKKLRDREDEIFEL